MRRRKSRRGRRRRSCRCSSRGRGPASARCRAPRRARRGAALPRRSLGGRRPTRAADGGQPLRRRARAPAARRRSGARARAPRPAQRLGQQRELLAAARTRAPRSSRAAAAACDTISRACRASSPLSARVMRYHGSAADGVEERGAQRVVEVPRLQLLRPQRQVAAHVGGELATAARRADARRACGAAHARSSSSHAAERRVDVGIARPEPVAEAAAAAARAPSPARRPSSRSARRRRSPRNTPG